MKCLKTCENFDFDDTWNDSVIPCQNAKINHVNNQYYKCTNYKSIFVKNKENHCVLCGKKIIGHCRQTRDNKLICYFCVADILNNLADNMTPGTEFMEKTIMSVCNYINEDDHDKK